MEIVENVTRYRCSFCRKEYQRKHFVPAHEDVCGKNPKNCHACFDCVHLSRHEEERESPDFHYEKRTILIFACDAQEEAELYTYKAPDWMISEYLPEATLMPNECALQKTHLERLEEEGAITNAVF